MIPSSLKKKGWCHVVKKNSNTCCAELKCIKCKKVLEDQGGIWNVNHGVPYGGVLIQSAGHYGSSVVDSMDGEDNILFCICDDCLKEAIDDKLVTYFDIKITTRLQKRARRLRRIHRKIGLQFRKSFQK